MEKEEEPVEVILEEPVPQHDWWNSGTSKKKLKQKANPKKSTTHVPQKTTFASTRKKTKLRAAKTVHISSNKDAPLAMFDEEEQPANFPKELLASTSPHSPPQDPPSLPITITSIPPKSPATFSIPSSYEQMNEPNPFATVFDKLASNSSISCFSIYRQRLLSSSDKKNMCLQREHTCFSSPTP